MKKVILPWYNIKEVAVKKVDEINRLFKGTGLKAKLLTKMVGKDHLKCEEYVIVLTKEKWHVDRHVVHHSQFNYI